MLGSYWQNIQRQRLVLYYQLLDFAHWLLRATPLLLLRMKLLLELNLHPLRVTCPTNSGCHWTTGCFRQGIRAFSELNFELVTRSDAWMSFA